MKQAQMTEMISTAAKIAREMQPDRWEDDASDEQARSDGIACVRLSQTRVCYGVARVVSPTGQQRLWPGRFVAISRTHPCSLNACP